MFVSSVGYQVITTPLPSGGPVLVSMLNILDGFNFTKKDQDKSVTYHYIVEVSSQALLCLLYELWSDWVATLCKSSLNRRKTYNPTQRVWHSLSSPAAQCTAQNFEGSKRNRVLVFSTLIMGEA